MRVYRLTSKGRRMARQVNSPDTSGWRAVHFIDFRGNASDDQLAEHGTSPGDIRRLKSLKVIEEVGGSEEL